MTESLRDCIRAAQQGNKAAMDRLLADNTPLVWSVVRRFYGRGCEPEDLFQLGAIGLVKAVRKFDLSLPVEFSTYAVPMIVGEIRRFLRDDGPVKVSRTLKERAQHIRQVQQRLEQQGRSPRLSDLCGETGFSPEEVLEALNAPRDTDSLDAAVGDGGRTLGELLPVGGENRVLEGLALRTALEQLEPRLRQILLLRYARDLTQQKIALLLGLTQVQVSRLEKKARIQLQTLLRETG